MVAEIGPGFQTVPSGARVGKRESRPATWAGRLRPPCV